MSSDFFMGLSGNIRYPDARINQGGPLPDDLRGGPEGANGVPFGKYNASSQLLANVRPYAMPNNDSLNANSNYREKARRVAMCIPGVMLPEPDTNATETFSLFHAVDNGDMAFLVKPLSSRKYCWLFPKPYTAQREKDINRLTNVNVFLNIVQVNYVLAGIVNRLMDLTSKGETTFANKTSTNAWDTLMSSFGYHVETQIEEILKKQYKGKENSAEFFFDVWILLQHLLQFHIVPFGICAGSEKQGGQHEGRDKPVQAATSYVTTMTVDGQNKDLVNVWRSVNVDGGDQLVVHLTPVKRSGNVPYTLNHWPKGTVTKIMKYHEQLHAVMLQLAPSFYKSGKEDDSSIVYKEKMEAVKILASLKQDHENYDYEDAYTKIMDFRMTGYWHCAQTYTKAGKYGLISAPYNDAEYLRGGLLQVNWAPVWKSVGFMEMYNDLKNNEMYNSFASKCEMFYVTGQVPELQSKVFRRNIKRRLNTDGQSYSSPVASEPVDLGFGEIALHNSQQAEMHIVRLPEALSSAAGLDAPEAPPVKARKRPPPKINFLDTASAEEVELERLFASKP